MTQAKLDNFALARRIRAGDMEARDEMIVGNLGLVFDLAKKLPRTQINHHDWDNLIQDGCLGLIAAVDRFDPDKGVKFSCYARFYILRYLFESINRSKYRAIDVTIGLAYGKPRRRCDDVENLRKAEAAKNIVPIDGLEIANEENDQFAMVYHEEEKARLPRLVDRLRGKERSVIEATFLTGEYHTMSEVARVLGLSRCTVKIYIERACKRLRQYARCS